MLSRLRFRGESLKAFRYRMAFLLVCVATLFSIFYYLARQRREQGGDGELDDVPVLQEIIRRHGMTGVLFDGELHDAGTPAGYARANHALTIKEAGPGKGPAC